MKGGEIGFCGFLWLERFFFVQKRLWVLEGAGDNLSFPTNPVRSYGGLLNLKGISSSGPCLLIALSNFMRTTAQPAATRFKCKSPLDTSCLSTYLPTLFACTKISSYQGPEKEFE